MALAFQDHVLQDAAALWEGRGDVGALDVRSPSATSPQLSGHSVALAAPLHATPRTSLLVFGLHMSGMALNHELTALGATMDRTVKTSPFYRMALLKRGEKRVPGVWRQPGNSGLALEGEVWSLPEDKVGAFFTRVLPPLCLGSVELADGTWVKGFLAEASACEAAEDISRYGGWRGWIDSGVSL
jgi:allophanate hydrolase